MPLILPLVIVAGLEQEVVTGISGEQQVIEAALPVAVFEGAAAHGVVDNPDPVKLEQVIKHLSPAAQRRFLEGIGFDSGIPKGIHGGEHVRRPLLKGQGGDSDFPDANGNIGLFRLDFDIHNIPSVHILAAPLLPGGGDSGGMADGNKPCGIPMPTLQKPSRVHAGDGHIGCLQRRGGDDLDLIGSGWDAHPEGHAEAVVMLLLQSGRCVEFPCGCIEAC
ncbi:hypothetical protein D3C75_769460 [compost metagenome]